MVRKKRIVIWDAEAAEQLKEIYDYIKPDSLQAAQKVKSEILATTKIIPFCKKKFLPLLPLRELRQASSLSYNTIYYLLLRQVDSF